eukprot:360488-Chlamydomonas_euryale.AAC.1
MTLHGNEGNSIAWHDVVPYRMARPCMAWRCRIRHGSMLHAGSPCKASLCCDLPSPCPSAHSCNHTWPPFPQPTCTCKDAPFFTAARLTGSMRALKLICQSQLCKDAEPHLAHSPCSTANPRPQQPCTRNDDLCERGVAQRLLNCHASSVRGST